MERDKSLEEAKTVATLNTQNNFNHQDPDEGHIPKNYIQPLKLLWQVS